MVLFEPPKHFTAAIYKFNVSPWFFCHVQQTKDYNGCSGKLQCQHKFNSKTTAWHFIRLCIIYMQQRIEHILYFLRSIEKIANNTPCERKKRINFLCHGNTLNVGNVSILCWVYEKCTQMNRIVIMQNNTSFFHQIAIYKYPNSNTFRFIRRNFHINSFVCI